MSNVNNVNMTKEQLQAELEKLRAENAKLAANQRPVSARYKVSPKGGVTVFGITRPQFAPTLYASQWEALLARKDEILAFIEANRSKLSVKAPAPTAPIENK